MPIEIFHGNDPEMDEFPFGAMEQLPFSSKMVLFAHGHLVFFPASHV